jgi:predicted nuclease of predicted toxin-antitoxin system
MKLLFDQNLSSRLVSRLADICPDGSHVSLAGLDRASDDQVWDYARANGYTIVTKDSDFNERSVLRGFPPKVIWLRLGNCVTGRVEATLREHQAEIRAFIEDPILGVLELF